MVRMFRYARPKEVWWAEPRRSLPVVSEKERCRRCGRDGKLTYCCETWSTMAGIFYGVWMQMGVKVKNLGGSRV